MTLPYSEQGDGGGPAAIFLHAFVDSRRSFDGVLAHLPEWVHAVAPDQRGHGDAPKPETGYQPADFADDLEALMDGIGVDAAILVASSSAGFTARCFAAAHPERTRGLVFIGSPSALAGKPAVEAMRPEFAALEDPVELSFVREFVAGTASAAVPPAFLELMVDESCKVPAHVWRLTFDGLLDPGTPSEVLPGPALLIWGEDDAFLDRADQEALAATFADAELRAYPGTGHIVHWEAPARVAADLAAFVQRAG